MFSDIRYNHLYISNDFVILAFCIVGSSDNTGSFSQSGPFAANPFKKFPDFNCNHRNQNATRGAAPNLVLVSAPRVDLGAGRGSTARNRRLSLLLLSERR